MLKIILDISPAIVNRTAVHHMVLDLGEQLATTFDLELSVCGKIESHGQSPKKLIQNLTEKQRSTLFKRIINHTERACKAQDIEYFPALDYEVKPTLYLDALFTPIKTGPASRDIVVIHDLTPLTHPQWHRPEISRAYHQAFLRVAASGCTIVSDSQSTTDELRFHLGVDPDRICTLPLYLRRQQANLLQMGQPKSKDKFLLFVGSLELRKNIIGLFRSFAYSKLHEKGYSLLIVGMDGNGAEDIRHEAERTSGVSLLGFVSEERLSRLYADCEAFVYPSFWEGFGMPLLEAMARSCLCISTMTGASPEVGGDAVIYVDPCDPISITAGLLTVHEMEENARQLLKRLAEKRATSFTAEKYVDNFTNLIHRHAGKIA
jgi:glycosyltransferase involved in cell wall biosynthesis